jgi:hypothetical protein
MTPRAYVMELERQLDAGTQCWNLRETFTFGALYRRRIRALLDSYGLRSNEHRGFLDSQFIVLVSTRTEMASYIAFSKQMIEFMAHLQATDVVEQREEILAQNRHRRLTFRAPLDVPFEGMTKDEIAVAIFHTM